MVFVPIVLKRPPMVILLLLYMHLMYIYVTKKHYQCSLFNGLMAHNEIMIRGMTQITTKEGAELRRRQLITEQSLTVQFLK